MAEYSLLQQQRMEAKAAMLRIFRFKARRGVGVFYSLVSLLLLGAFLLFGRSYSPFLVLAGVFVAATAVWYVAEAAGFRGFDRMTYSLEFLEGGEELVRERRRWFTNPHLLRLRQIGTPRIRARILYASVRDDRAFEHGTPYGAGSPQLKRQDHKLRGVGFAGPRSGRLFVPRRMRVWREFLRKLQDTS